MHRTKLGISVGLLGACVYLMGSFGGFLLTVFLVGYILLFEENEWLKKNAVKAVILMTCFTLAITVFNLIPSAISAINNIAGIFGGRVSVPRLTNVTAAIVDVIDIMEKVLLIALGVKALKQGSIAIPAVDRLINTYMG